MNSLFFPPHLKLINITPFKISMCCLIHGFFKDKEIYSDVTKSFLFDSIYALLSDFKCEISQNYFFEKLSKNLQEKALRYSLTLDQITNTISKIMKMLENYNRKIKSINDLYVFFNYEIRDLQLKNDNAEVIFEKGGIIDNYIRKIMFAFYKLSFEELCKLHSNLYSYKSGEEQTIHLTANESEKLFEKQMIDANKVVQDNLDEKLLKSFNYKHKYYHMARTMNEKAFDLNHKFFDHNMKYFYSDSALSETKIHYALMNLIQQYYSEGYYEQAIEVLIESIKLNQSNCDHEGLMKCFLWLQKIYRNIGNFEIAKKCLSMCLVKSFENNFPLLYMMSTNELAVLNFQFSSNIGEKSDHKNPTIEEKILSYSDSFSYSYKNIFDFVSGSKKDFVYEKSNSYYIKFLYFNIIMNLTKNGKFSLAIFYLDKCLSLIGDEIDHYSFETVELIFQLLINLFQYDPVYITKKFYHITQKIQVTKEIIKFGYIFHLFKQEFLAMTDNNLDNSDENTSYLQIKHNTYMNLKLKYLELNNMLRNYKYIDDYEVFELKNKCKEEKFLKLKFLSNILISELYLSNERIIEAMFKINKSMKKAESDEYAILQLNLTMAKIYSISKNTQKLSEILEIISINIEKCGCVLDKYDYYSLKMQFEIFNFIEGRSQTINIELVKKYIAQVILTSNCEYMSNSLYIMNLISISYDSRATECNRLIEIVNNHLSQSRILLSSFTQMIISPISTIQIINILQNQANLSIDKIYSI